MILYIIILKILNPISRLAVNSKNHSALMLQKDLEKHIKVINRSEKTYENQMGTDIKLVNHLKLKYLN